MADEKINISVFLKNNATKGLNALKGSLSGLTGVALKLAKVGLVAVSVAIGKAIFDAQKFEKGLTNVFTLLNRGDFDKFGKNLEKAHWPQWRNSASRLTILTRHYSILSLLV